MSQHYLNYFFPHTKDVSHHEISLTRAFFALLKLCPIVHAQLIHMVREQIDDFPTFLDLQESSIDLEDTKIFKSGPEEGRNVLVLLTGAPAPVEKIISKTDKGRRFDAVVEYKTGDRLIFEAKIGSANAKDYTIRPSDNFDQERPAQIKWNDLIEKIFCLIECQMLRGADEQITRQFLEYVEEKFPSLCPYSNLYRCSGNAIRIQALCNQIMSQSKMGASEGNRLDFGRGKIARFGYLDYEDERKRIVLSLFPADTIGQARDFYNRKFVEATLGLAKKKSWSVEPNLHLSAMAKGCMWTAGELELEEYMRYWLKLMPQHVQTDAGDKKEGFITAFDSLVRSKLASENDRANFNRHFKDTNRQTMNICPGLRMKYEWTLAEAEKLDKEGHFASDVKARINEGLSAWGEGIEIA